MATNPSTLPENSGRITAPDANYPYGSAKDDSTGTTGDGTPIKKALLNDTYGFQQWLLNLAGIVPSGAADNVNASDYGNALRVLAAGLTYASVVNYPVNSYAKGSDGDLYRARVANGPASSVVDPVGDNTGTWVSVFRATKGQPLNDSAQVGYTFEDDGDSGLFAEGGDAVQNSDLLLRIDGDEYLRVKKDVGVTSLSDNGQPTIAAAIGQGQVSALTTGAGDDAIIALHKQGSTGVALRHISYGTMELLVADGADGSRRVLSHTDNSGIIATSGGDNSDLPTGSPVTRLTLPFTAVSPKLTAFCKARISNAVGTANDVNLEFELFNVTLASQVALDTDVTTTTGAFTAAGKLVGGLSIGSLTVGNNYELRIKLAKTIADGPVQPQNMRIDAITRV